MRQILSTIGNIAAALFNILFTHLQKSGVIEPGTGWRWMFLVGALPALLVVFTMRYLREPEPWLRLTGSADLKLSSNRTKLEGAWTNSADGSGNWVIVRKNLVPQPAPDVKSGEPGWVQLFNGKELDGWQTHSDQPGEWKVKDGILIGSGPLRHLFKKIDWDNFHLRVVAQINEGGSGTVTYRVPEVALKADKSPIGHRVEINSLKGFPVTTGSLTILDEPKQIVPSTLPPPKAGESERRLNDSVHGAVFAVILPSPTPCLVHRLEGFVVNIITAAPGMSAG